VTDESTVHGACQFAALYSLGALEEPDEWRFKEHLLDGCGACAREVAQFESVGNLLAYAAPAVAPPPILRDRVIDAVAEPESRIERLAGPSAEWQRYSVPGISYRQLHVDRQAREVVMLVRAVPGARYPVHRHASAEDMFMLEGELDFEGTVYRAGDFIRSAEGSLHAASETRTGCMFLIRASLDDEVC
jgi:anti-sigma factor ChrR (cupin superfamily)